MASRVFLFLQGPHGPFFSRLAAMVRSAGCVTWRVGFNAGDSLFWPHRASFIPWRGTQEDWAAAVGPLMDEKGVTDLVLYGDVRRIHADAIAEARARGLRVHVFEEGYMRPYWITYERGGSNGHSKLMTTSVAEMRGALAQSDLDLPETPAQWGDMRQHVFWGAAYHGAVMLANWRYRAFRPHRDLPVAAEAWLYAKRLITMPWSGVQRLISTRRVTGGGYPYHLALLQLEHDSSFQAHSPFASMTEFLDVVVRGFAEGAPPHHHLVFKAHPLEDGRVAQRGEIARLAREHGVARRVHYIRGGKLARLLSDARSAVTVNSTAAQQALWRGLPVKAFGSAVYAKPEFVSTQSLAEFFCAPARPDAGAYKDFRRYLLETSQVAGGFYSSRGRQALLRQVVDMMLAPDDPYDAFAKGRSEPRKHLRAVT